MKTFLIHLNGSPHDRPVEAVSSILSRGSHTFIVYRYPVGRFGIKSEIVDEPIETINRRVAFARRY